ncbi:hypothetical protein ONA00_06410 [Mycoplasmopsis cynos]|nr:hypothetical protein [Mycoplasmopsis cynos]WAM10886.1 hypothetical protein ONA00_06410 [Mycoplasmopsis cynos]
MKDLSFYLHKKLAELSNVIVYSKPGDYICLLNIKNVHPQDVATYLETKIFIRYPESFVHNI